MYLFLCFCLLATVSQGYILTGTYDVTQDVLMQDGSGENVGYQVTSTLVATQKSPNVYLMKLNGPQLFIMSRKAPTPNGFVPHFSKLESAVNKDFIVEYEDGLINGVHFSSDDSISMKNLKKAIISSFQIRKDLKNGKETDSSGICQVTYSEASPGSVYKTKSHCSHSIADFSTDIWGGSIKSESKSFLSIVEDKINSVTWSESVSMVSHLADYAVVEAVSTIDIRKKSDEGEPDSMKYSGTKADVVALITIELGGMFVESDLTLEKESDTCVAEECPPLDQVVRELKTNLGDYGSAKSALAVVKVANAMSRSNQQEIHKVLNNKDNKQLIGILLDIAGSVQTFDSHQAVLRKLKLNTDKYNLDYCERYLWALSLYPKPSLNITKEMVQIVKAKHHDKKLFQTLLQTGAAMVHKITILHNEPNHELMGEIIEAMKEELSNCEDDDESCRQQYLLALGQTRSPLALPTLIKYVTFSTTRSGVTALKGIQKIDRFHWTPEVFKLAEQVLLSDTGYDSSARAISLDILMSNDISDSLVRKMLYLLSNRTQKEINQLILQKLYYRAERYPAFAKRLSKLVNEECNWNKLAQGGLSASFSRYFMDNGFLSTDQEISSGILKRGLVHVNLAHNNTDHTLFTLGLFSTGLNSFMSSSEDSNGEEEEEATAGMQIQLLGVEFRPFVFFTGSGDLMGHVWSGTASTETPAYQATLIVSRKRALIPIGPAGTWADLTLDVAASLELAGLIEISLWNRNANSAVFNRLGLLQSGGIKANSEFVHTKIDLQLSTEPSLDLTSQIDFSSSVALCLKLYQPTIAIRYNTYKVERIPGSKHKLRKSLYSTRSVPGKTYALNRKNNEMCNAIH